MGGEPGVGEVLARHPDVAGAAVTRGVGGFAGLLTVPGFLTTFGPVGMRSQFLMTIALRVMGNLITEEDSDSIARIWRTAGRASIKFDDRPPFS